MEPCDDLPFSTICPIPVPHKFYGLSVAETVEDVQLVRSTLTRNLMDNMYWLTMAVPDCRGSG